MSLKGTFVCSLTVEQVLDAQDLHPFPKRLLSSMSLPKAHLPRMGLLSLPRELLIDIIRSLQRKELKALRQVNGELNAVVSGELFRSIAIQSSNSSMRQLENIVHSGTWYLQVNSIRWLLTPQSHTLNPSEEMSKRCRLIRELVNVVHVHLLLLPHNGYINNGSQGTEDVYLLLKAAKLRPKTLAADSLAFEMRHTDLGALKEVYVTSIIPCDCKKPLKPDEHLCETNSMHVAKLTDWRSSDLENFDSLAFAESFTLQVVDLRSVKVTVQFLSTLLSESLKIRRLELVDVVLKDPLSRFKQQQRGSNDDLEHRNPLIFLLQNIKVRKKNENAFPITVSLRGVWIEDVDGNYDINDSDINKWVEGQDSDFLIGSRLNTIHIKAPVKIQHISGYFPR